jgi:hypothetical protein
MRVDIVGASLSTGSFGPLSETGHRSLVTGYAFCPELHARL